MMYLYPNFSKRFRNRFQKSVAIIKKLMEKVPF